MQALLVLAALRAWPASAAKTGSERQAHASDRDSGRLVRSEAVVGAGADVLLLDSRDIVARMTANCSMATVFGPDSKAWPATVAQAKGIQLAYCMVRGYSNATCTGIIDEHFKNHSLTQGPDSLTMTPRFCEESVALLSLDTLHQGNGSANVTLLLEDSAGLTSGGQDQWWWWSSSCADTCADGSAMVYKGWAIGCVCKWCENNNWQQVQLCRRKCYVGDTHMCAQCFPSSAAVSVLMPDGAVATRAMEDLRVGDHVHTAGGFSRVFAFMDHASDTEAEYVQLKTASGYELSLTADHIVYAHAEQTPVLAGTIVEGDLLWTASGVGAEFVQSRVVQVQHGLERGMHAPLTEEGSVVVNGILSSSYAKVKSLRWGATVLVSGHDLNRYMHEPLRLACGLVPRLCEREWHSAEGRHVWTQLILDRFGWLQAMNSDHSDIRSALVVEPSVFSWLAGFAQLVAAAVLSAVFGRPSRVALLAVVAASLAAAERRVRAKKDLRHQGRPTPAPATPSPTAPPTPGPTAAPTPEPTYVHEYPGVPCLCNKPSCFERYDLDNDTCITQAECDLQWPLMGNCTTTPATYGPPTWDLDGDGCLNYTEWEIIYDDTNGSVCPIDEPSPCDECPEGYIIVSNPCECEQCVGGEVRRRRSLECTPCPSPYIDKGDYDECKDPSTPGLSNATNGSSNITVFTPYQTCDQFSLGDTITISGTVDGDVLTHTTIVIGITPITGGFEIDLHEKLPADFTYDATVQQTCTSTDGTQVSNSFSPFSGGCCCACGTDCCESTEVCTVYPNGTGVCSPAGPYPEFSTPAPTVGAKGDPHLVNLQGEHFDINHEGEFTLIRFPQAAEAPAEFSLQAAIQPDVGKPCTTYITQVELSGAWLGGKSLQIRCYRRSHSNDTDAFLGARLLEGDSDSPWQTIEEFQSKDLVLSDSDMTPDIEVSLDKATWFPKKRSKKGPTAAGMFTLSLRNTKSTTGAKVTVRQDLPEQEHLNVAVRQLSHLGRVDVGGLLGFDAHPESLERPSAACVHHRATASYRIESQDEADHGYYFRPAWKDRWNKVRSGGRPQDNEAAASLVRKFDGNDANDYDVGGKMCKCPSEDGRLSGGSVEGVIVEEASFVFAEASWE